MYTTQDNVESALDRPLTAGEASYLNGVLLPAISGYIDRETGTYFGSDEEVEVFVNGSGTERLIIPTMWEVSKVKHGSSIVGSGQYRLYPSKSPYLAITRRDGKWQKGIENYTVTGKLGYEGVPADITAIATELAVNYFSTIKEDGAVIKSERTGDNSVTYADMSSSLSITSLSTLTGYRRLSRSI